MLCESGWTGDRCMFVLDHDGPHSNEEPPACDACGGRFDTTTDSQIEAETDNQVADDEFEPSDVDPTICANDGWMKIEHDLKRNLLVHESCFLDHDDILVRV